MLSFSDDETERRSLHRGDQRQRLRTAAWRTSRHRPATPRPPAAPRCNPHPSVPRCWRERFRRAAARRRGGTDEGPVWGSDCPISRNPFGNIRVPSWPAADRHQTRPVIARTRPRLCRGVAKTWVRRVKPGRWTVERCGKIAHRATSHVVVPSLLSISTTPKATISSRRRSDSAQFFAARAATRAAMSASTCAGSTESAACLRFFHASAAFGQEAERAKIGAEFLVSALPVERMQLREHLWRVEIVRQRLDDLRSKAPTECRLARQRRTSGRASSRSPPSPAPSSRSAGGNACAAC